MKLIANNIFSSIIPKIKTNKMTLYNNENEYNKDNRFNRIGQYSIHLRWYLIQNTTL